LKFRDCKCVELFVYVPKSVNIIYLHKYIYVDYIIYLLTCSIVYVSINKITQALIIQAYMAQGSMKDLLLFYHRYNDETKLINALVSQVFSFLQVLCAFVISSCMLHVFPISSSLIETFSCSNSLRYLRIRNHMSA
jgi:hypothetical protein